MASTSSRCLCSSHSLPLPGCHTPISMLSPQPPGELAREIPESTRPQRVCVLAEPGHVRILQAIWHARCLNVPINATAASSDCSWPRHSRTSRPSRDPPPRSRLSLLAESDHARMHRSSRPQRALIVCVLATCRFDPVSDVEFCSSPSPGGQVTSERAD